MSAAITLLNELLKKLEDKRKEFNTAASKKGTLVKELISINKLIAHLQTSQVYKDYLKQTEEKKKIAEKLSKKQKNLKDAQETLHNLEQRKSDIGLAINNINNALDYEIITLNDNDLIAYNIDYMNYGEYPNGKDFVYKINIDNINDEKIIKIYSSIIKTDKAFYSISSRKTNKEQCDKYADVKCEYEYFLKKEEILSKYYEEIMNISSNYFITYNYELISMAVLYYEP